VGLAVAEVGIALVAEEDASAADDSCWSAGREGCQRWPVISPSARARKSLRWGVVLAEQHVGRVAPASKLGVALDLPVDHPGLPSDEPGALSRSVLLHAMERLVFGRSPKLAELGLIEREADQIGEMLTTLSWAVRRGPWEWRPGGGPRSRLRRA
jgi:hypothetical protein